ncbi:hypothetical protein D3C75_1168010 [compost metagenome]
MNIDWSKAPEGATHYNCGSQFFYRFVPKAEFWSEGFNGWTDAAAPSPKHYTGDEWLVRPAQVEISRRSKACDEMFGVILSMPEEKRHNRSDICEALYDAGYRKFEIVEEDV